jgi:hypothetical protein
MVSQVGLLEGRHMTARTFYVEIYCETDLTQEALEAQLDSVMEALQSEPGEADIDLGANLEAGHVDFCVHLPAQTVTEAVSDAVSTVRSALHGLGHCTPGWEKILATLDRGTAAVTARPADAEFDLTGRTPTLT